MGLVYLAQDPVLKRPLAIKVLRNRSEGPETALRRFQREAEISARLNHPNIVTIFDVGEDPALGPFLAMEYVEGSSLAQVIRQTLPLDLKFHLLSQVGDALSAAAEEGITHRDVKPENILVRKDGRAKLMDFGIARREESHLTAVGMFFGTPSYSAPELLLGAEATPATDQYAFAVTALEVLTGSVPHAGASLSDTLLRIVHEPPALPETLAPALAAVFRRAFAKDPAERHPDLHTLMRELLEASDLSPESRRHLLARLDGGRLYGVTRPLEHLGFDLDLPPAPGGDRRTRPMQPGPAPTPTPTDPHPRANQSPVGEATTGPQERPSSIPPSPPVPLLVDPPAIPPPAPREIPPKPRRRWGAGLAVLTLGALLALGFGLAWRARAPRPLHLEVRTVPSPAEVLLDGRLVGHTPLVGLQIPAPGGDLTVRAPDHEPQQRTLVSGDTRLEFRLARTPYRIDVLTEPEGAEVLLNGTAVGRAPLRALPVPREGTQHLRVRLEGFQEWHAVLDPELPFPDLIRLSPLPPPPRRRR